MTVKKFFDEACIAEQKRKSFLEIGVSGSQLDASAVISVNRWEARGTNGGKSSGQKKHWKAKSDNAKAGVVPQPRATGSSNTTATPGPGVARSDNVSTTNDTVSGQGGAKSKKSRACFKCGLFGHWANKCRVAVKDQKQHSGQQKSYQQHNVKKADVVSDETDSEQLEWNFQALEIVALQKPVKPADRHTLSPAVKLCDGGGGVRSLRQVEALATAVGAHHVTNNPIMTRVALEEVLLAEFECDTAASHSVISAELFKQLQRKLGRTLIGKKERKCCSQIGRWICILKIIW